MRAPDPRPGRGAPETANDGEPGDVATSGSVLDRWRASLTRSADERGAGVRRSVPVVGGFVSPVRLLAGLGLVGAAVAVGVFSFVLANHGSVGEVAPVSPPAPEAAVDTTLGPETGSTAVRPPGRGTATTRAEVVVHAAGSVVHPGVYRLPGGSRVADLIEAAGGLALDADANRVNLAAPLTDGGRLYVPRRDEVSLPVVVGSESSAGGGVGAGSSGRPGAPTTARGPVNINTADAAALDTLPGIGPATSAAIIDYRTQHGPFRAVDDLSKVRGIGKAKLDQLRPLVTT